MFLGRYYSIAYFLEESEVFSAAVSKKACCCMLFVSIITQILRLQLKWESASVARKRSRVRIPDYFNIHLAAFTPC
jgi:hypothetical protein